MQIQGTPSAMMYPARPAQRPVSNPASALPPGATAPAAQGGPAQQQIDVAKILEHWGTSNAEADLNTDGIVDAQDLALASSQQNSGVGGVASGWGQSGVSDLNGDGIVNGADLGLLLGAWGIANGSPYDLNHDGVIDGADLGLLLGCWTN